MGEGGRDGGKGREGMNTSVNKGDFTNGMGGLQEILACSLAPLTSKL